MEEQGNGSLPYASSLCGACYDVCPVAINIPDILVHLRDQDVRATHAKKKAEHRLPRPSQMDLMMKGARAVMSSGTAMSLAERGLPAGRLAAGPNAKLSWLPGVAGGWTDERDIQAPPKQAFRHWWASRDKVKASGAAAQTGSAERTTDSTHEEDAR